MFARMIWVLLAGYQASVAHGSVEKIQSHILVRAIPERRHASFVGVRSQKIGQQHGNVVSHPALVLRGGNLASSALASPLTFMLACTLKGDDRSSFCPICRVTNTSIAAVAAGIWMRYYPNQVHFTGAKYVERAIGYYLAGYFFFALVKWQRRVERNKRGEVYY